ncbi:efflux RND transporter periplasmic adaptor subunit [bacterium]|nr:efflux RND transporter periplasmic adaptor subunit [bacterium]
MKKYSLILIPCVVLVLAWMLVVRVVGGKHIDAVHPVHGPAVEAVYATGTVEATVMMPIAPRVAARLAELNVDEGFNVTKDQVMARLEDDDLQHALGALRAKQELAEKEYARSAVLVKKHLVTKENYDVAKANLESAKAAVSQATAQANFMKLVAPADGLVIKRDGEIGQLISANPPVFWISCCAPLRISAEVDEEDISRVVPGQPVLIRADAFPGKTFNGKVQAITPMGDPVARSYRVRIQFDGEVPLRIGMTAETNIILRETKNALLIPSGAVIEDSIWLIEDGKLVKRKPQIGAKGPSQIEIRGGLKDDSLVVLKPYDTLKEGEHVRARLVKGTP